MKRSPKVLWCYQKSLILSSNVNKRLREIKKQKQRGLYDPSTVAPFEDFLSSTDIRFGFRPCIRL